MKIFGQFIFDRGIEINSAAGELFQLLAGDSDAVAAETSRST